MGGFSIAVDDDVRKARVCDGGYATFTTNGRLALEQKGLLDIAAHGFFCHITDDAIKDKSKADYLAKFFVCLQIFWFGDRHSSCYCWATHPAFSSTKSSPTSYVASLCILSGGKSLGALRR